MIVAALASDEVLAFVLLDLGLILAAAQLVGRLARRLGQPTVVGEIAAGVLLGPSVLGQDLVDDVFPAQARSIVGVVGQLGLILFMFLVGLELDHQVLQGYGRAITIVSVGVMLVPMATGLALAPLLYNDSYVGDLGGSGPPSRLAFGLMVGSILAVTALPVMARLLQEEDLDRTRLGSVGITAAAVVSVLMFLAVATARDVAAAAGPAAILGSWLAAGLFVAVLLGLVRPALGRLGPRIEHRGSVTTGELRALMALLLAVALVAHRLGINVIPGAFLFGLILPARSVLRPAMAARLRDVAVLVLLPVFLAFSGLNTDFRVLNWAVAGGLGLLIVAGVAAKWIGGVVSARLGGLSGTEANAIGILMNCRGLLVLVVGLVAVESGVVSPTLQVAGVLMALLTTVMTAPLLSRTAVVRAARSEAAAEEPVAQAA